MGLKKLLIDSGLYTFCNVLVKGLNFILLPMYTAYLSAADYGVTGLMDSFRSVMGFVCIFSLNNAVMRFYFDYKGNQSEMERYVGTLFVFSVLSSLAWGIGFCIFQQWLMPALFPGVSFWPTVAVSLLGLVFSTLYGHYQILLRSMELARNFVFTSLLYFALTTLLTIVFIVPLRLGADGVLAAQALANLVFAAYGIWDLSRRKMMRLCLDWNILKGMLLYSLPLMPHNLSTHLSNLVSMLLINGNGSLAAAGIYNLASKFGVIADTLQSSLNSAYQPWLFSQLKEDKDGLKDRVREFTEVLLWGLAAAFVVFGLFIQELILAFLDASYAQAWPLIPLIIMVYSVKTVYYFYVAVLFYYKKASKFIFVATCTSSILNIALSVPLISLWGAYGSVAADAAAMILRVAIVISISKKFDDVGYRVGQFVRVTLVVCLTLTIGLFFSYTKFMYTIEPFNIAWKFVVFLVFLVFACIVNRSYIARFVKKTK